MTFGHRDVSWDTLLRVVAIAGAWGEEVETRDEIYLRFTRPTYTPAQMIELATLIAELRPDYCVVDGGELLLRWD